MPKILRAIKPNAGIRAAYRKELQSMIAGMTRSVNWWIGAEYRKQEERITQDASPAVKLAHRIKKLRQRWSQWFFDRADMLARKFIGRVFRRTFKAFEAAFRDAGVPTVKMSPHRVTNDIVQALIAENVALIRSLPEEYFTRVEGIVNRAVVAGRDMAMMTADLHKLGVKTERRAQLIARDQIDKATESIKRVECQQMGITEGIWVHIPGAKTSRATHKAMNGKRFVLSEGMYDSAVGRNVHCGELPFCRCTFRMIIPEFGE